MKKPTSRQIEKAIDILNLRKEVLQKEHPYARNEIADVDGAIMSLMAYQQELESR